jgi:hypothetical protein
MSSIQEDARIATETIAVLNQQFSANENERLSLAQRVASVMQTSAAREAQLAAQVAAGLCFAFVVCVYSNIPDFFFCMISNTMPLTKLFLTVANDANAALELKLNELERLLKTQALEAAEKLVSDENKSDPMQ